MPKRAGCSPSTVRWTIRWILRKRAGRVLFASDADPAIKEALTPLIDRRKSQVNDEKLFRVFDGPAGVRPNQTAGSWALAKGVSLAAPVGPRRGVPFYLLIVGSPQRIPFEFQAQFDLQWAVGRLHFDKVADYASYAQKVVDVRGGARPGRKSGAPPSGCRATPATWRRRCSPARSAPISSGRATPLRSASGSASR